MHIQHQRRGRRHSAWRPLAWLMVVGATLAASVQSVAREPDQKPPVTLPHEDAFRTRSTDHFLIWYDTNYAMLRPLVGRLEGTYRAVVRVGRAWGFAMDAPAEPMPIVLIDQHKDYALLAQAAQVDPIGAAGFYEPSRNIAIFGNILNGPSLRSVTSRIELLQDRRHRAGSAQARGGERELLSLVTRRAAVVKRFNRVVIQHEAAHQILFNLGVHALGADNPTWLIEGLATQFETAQTNPNGKLRRTNQLRLADLRNAIGVDRAVNKLSDARYARAFRGKGLIPLRELIADDSVIATNGNSVSTVYAQSWALVFYLAREHEPEFSQYLTVVSGRPIGRTVTPEEELTLFTASFGPVDESFQRSWLGYIVRLRVDPSAD